MKYGVDRCGNMSLFKRRVVVFVSICRLSRGCGGLSNLSVLNLTNEQNGDRFEAQNIFLAPRTSANEGFQFITLHDENRENHLSVDYYNGALGEKRVAHFAFLSIAMSRRHWRGRGVLIGRL